MRVQSQPPRLLMPTGHLSDMSKSPRFLAPRWLAHTAAALVTLSCLNTPAGAAGAALETVTLRLPEGGKLSAPFDRPRQLRVPPGYAIDLVARVPGARFLALAPNGDLLVSQPGSGGISLLAGAASGNTSPVPFADGLRKPHDMVFHQLDGKTWLYVAESHRIIRVPWQSGQRRLGEPEVVVDKLPDSSSPELRGSYGHELKNIALKDGKLYVSIASTCNACETDVNADPVRGAIYEYEARGGKPGRLFARGIRNAEGLDFRPGSNELWVVVNNRDNIAYPFHKDADGDGSDDYGKVLPSWVDSHPPELLLKVRDGGNYGWPYCNSNPDQGMDNMPYDRDVELNPDGSKLDCSKLDRPARGIAAHTAPLGMSFLPTENMNAPLAGGLAVALHGCWNCTHLNGHKVVLYRVGRDGRVSEETDVVTGWLQDAKKRQRWGRPVDVIADDRGGLFISDDHAGAVYRLHPQKGTGSKP